MSRIGRKPIQLPVGVSVQEHDGVVSVQGPKGILELTISPDIAVVVEEGGIVIKVKSRTKKTPALWGLTRALVANAVEGVSRGFKKRLELEGIGYRASKEGSELVMQLGFSHPVRMMPPDGITIEVEKNSIIVSGVDRQKVGQVAADIRRFRKPEPYKGKGIRYAGEVLRRKAGKKAGIAATK